MGEADDKVCPPYFEIPCNRGLTSHRLKHEPVSTQDGDAWMDLALI